MLSDSLMVCRLMAYSQDESRRTRIPNSIDSPSTNILRVALGSVAVIPSRSFVSLTWQPNREVPVSPNAMSSMSFSSSYAQN